MPDPSSSSEGDPVAADGALESPASSAHRGVRDAKREKCRKSALIAFETRPKREGIAGGAPASTLENPKDPA